MFLYKQSIKIKTKKIPLNTSYLIFGNKKGEQIKLKINRKLFIPPDS